MANGCCNRLPRSSARYRSRRVETARAKDRLHLYRSQSLKGRNLMVMVFKSIASESVFRKCDRHEVRLLRAFMVHDLQSFESMRQEQVIMIQKHEPIPAGLLGSKIPSRRSTTICFSKHIHVWKMSCHPIAGTIGDPSSTTMTSRGDRDDQEPIVRYPRSRGLDYRRR